jgi:aconitate hydratase
MASHDSFNVRRSFTVGGQRFSFYSLAALEAAGFVGVSRLPYSLKILLENLLRREDGRFVDREDLRTLASWDPAADLEKEIAFMPARVLLQDFTGVPAVVDLAAMRDGMVALGGDPSRVNPLWPVELVIDHSVQVDHFAVANAAELNAPQPRAVRVPALGPDRVPQLPGGPARHRHRAPDQHRVSRARRFPRSW